MSDHTSAPVTTPAANPGRGATFALLAIPAAIVLFVIASFIFSFWGIAAIVVPTIAAGLYARGSGAPLGRSGWPAFVGITVVAILLGVVAGIVGRAWSQFSGVNGKGGLFGAPFLRTVGTQFSDGEAILPIIIALVVGAIGIFGVIRGPRTTTAPPVVTPGAMPPATPAASAPPVAPVAPPAAPIAPPAPNQPSPGVILNGKPIDPKAK